MEFLMATYTNLFWTCYVIGSWVVFVAQFWPLQALAINTACFKIHPKIAILYQVYLIFSIIL